MIPESYENEYSISLILTAFEVFLVWVTFRRLTLECCHLLGFQVPVPCFDLIFGIFETCWCETTWTIISGSSLVFAFFRKKHCVLFSVLRILPEWRWYLRAGVEQPFNCLIIQNHQAVQSKGRSMDWTLEDNMGNGLFFCATLIGVEKGAIRICVSRSGIVWLQCRGGGHVRLK